MSDTSSAFPGFEPFRVPLTAGEFVGVQGGEGPPVLLLHGHPQTHHIWRHVAPVLATQYRVIAADIRGYGASVKPPSTADHRPYSKRVMAGDMVELMRALGHARFALVGHDRGGRIGHRLCLDHPQAVSAFVALDIAPTRDMVLLHTKPGKGPDYVQSYYHWWFLARPYPLPETLLAAAPEPYLDALIGRTLSSADAFDDASRALYLAPFADPAHLHAICEDYRAALTIDLADDEADLDKKVDCPMLVLWGEKGVVNRCFDVLPLWQARAHHVQGATLPCGHYLPEEAPALLTQRLMGFLEKR